MTEVLWSVVLLVIGFVLLIKGADFFVEGSSSVAKRLKVPSIIIGLTIVAMGTSLPECAVSITASITNNNALAVSNAVGSNIFNLMVVCGFCALFNPLAVEKSTLKKEFPFSMICAVLLLVFGYLAMTLGRADGLLLLAVFIGLLAVEKSTLKKEFPFSMICAVLLLVFGYLAMTLGRADGLLLLAVFIGFLIWMVRSALKARAQASDEEYELLPVWKCLLFIIGGIIAIKFGGDFVVEGASAIAAKAGLSQNLIGLTIVACGTSLPELVTSVVAARKNELDMALGNVIGSNIFNILFVLGVAAAISPIAFIMENVIDIVILIAMSAVVWGFAWTKKMLDKKEGIVMLAMYAVYLVYICIR